MMVVFVNTEVVGEENYLKKLNNFLLGLIIVSTIYKVFLVYLVSN